jgi:uncharacterized protein YwgA
MEDRMAKKPGFNLKREDLPKMSVENWILVMLYNKEERRPRDAPTIMNEMLILTKDVAPFLELEFRFAGTGSGPYSKKIATAINQLISTGMFELKAGESSKSGNNYIMTESGAEKAKKLILKLPEEFKSELDFMHLTVAHMGSTGVLQYLHSIYPELVYLDRGGG